MLRRNASAPSRFHAPARHLPSAHRHVVEGQVSAHPNGFGFLRADPPLPSGDLFLPPSQMAGVLHGDRLRAEVLPPDFMGRTSGSVLDIIQRRNPRIVGRLSVSCYGAWLLQPDDRRLPALPLAAPVASTAQAGCIAVAEITAWPTPLAGASGRLVSVLGKQLAPSMAVDLAVAAHALPVEWPQEALDEAARLLPQDVGPTREDLRALPFITIDGADSRDFDDALVVEREGDGFRLTVAIADVSHFVEPGTALDAEAYRRGTSVYFPGHAIHMLPEALACELCSLQPGVDRLAMVCRMHVDAAGALSQVQLSRATIRSHARLTYDQAFTALSGNPDAVEASILPRLEVLRSLYRVLAAARTRRGAIAFDSATSSVSLDAAGEVVLAPSAPLNEAHGWIEECMIAANVAVARFLAQAGEPAPFRVHPKPTEQRYAELLEFMASHGQALPGRNDVTPLDFAEAIATNAASAAGAAVRMALQRAQAAAVYSASTRGHFGLALDDYTHFTSPIRRYPDLLVHRAVGRVLDGAGADGSAARMEAMATQCSANERRAAAAEREVVDRYRCAWLAGHADGVHAGTITGVKPFGLFVELQESGVSGLVHARTLDEDCDCEYDQGAQALCCQDGKVFRLGDRVSVHVVGVDVAERKVDMAITSAP